MSFSLIQSEKLKTKRKNSTILVKFRKEVKPAQEEQQVRDSRLRYPSLPRMNSLRENKNQRITSRQSQTITSTNV